MQAATGDKRRQSSTRHIMHMHQVRPDTAQLGHYSPIDPPVKELQESAAALVWTIGHLVHRNALHVIAPILTLLHSGVGHQHREIYPALDQAVSVVIGRDFGPPNFVGGEVIRDIEDSFGFQVSSLPKSERSEISAAN